MHLKVEREVLADAARSRSAEDRQAKAREKERVEAEHRAALATAADQNARLSVRIDELADMLRDNVGRPSATVEVRPDRDQFVSGVGGEPGVL